MNQEEAVADNAGLMAIKFFVMYGVKEIILAGFDGYSHDAMDNYGKSEMTIITRNAVLDAMNVGMSKVLRSYQKEIKISFLTKIKWINIE